jgi:hypothetical protein
MARYIIDSAPRVAPLPTGPDFRAAFVARRKGLTDNACHVMLHIVDPPFLD